MISVKTHITMDKVRTVLTEFMELSDAIDVINELQNNGILFREATNVVKVRLKPIQTEAMQFTGGAKQAEEIIQWILDNGGTARYFEAYAGYVLKASPEYIVVDMENGSRRIEAGDWVFKAAAGDFFKRTNLEKMRDYEEIPD